MKNILALTAAAAVLTLTSAAYAAGPACVNGYTTGPFEMVRPCSVEPSTFGFDTHRTHPQVSSATPSATGSRSALRGSTSIARYRGEPATTGSVTPHAGGSMMGTGPQDCKPGGYWMMRSPSVGPGDFETPMPCR